MSRMPSDAESVPFGADSFAAAASNEYRRRRGSRRGERDGAAVDGDAGARLEAGSSPRDHTQRLLARWLQMQHERVLRTGAETGRRPGDKDRPIVRSDRDAFRGLAVASGKLLVEQQAAVGTELDDQRGDVHETRLCRLDGSREHDRSVRCGRHSAARIHDFAGAVGPLPYEAAIGRDFEHEYVEVADLIRARRRARRIHASIRCDSNRISRCSVRHRLPHKVAG